jgi:hypothetical protein
MKLIIKFFILLLFVFVIFENAFATDNLSPYLKVGIFDFSMQDAVSKVKSALEAKNFEIVGEYQPAKNSNLYVIAYSRTDLKQVAVGVNDRGALASVLKIGFVKKDGKITVSMLNPMYLFYAYLGDNADTFKTKLEVVASDAKSAMATLSKEMVPFGGSVETDDLKEYHYMAMMPRFTDEVELREFSSFNEGLTTIRKNLDAGKGNTIKVYEVVFADKNIVVFGVGLADPEKGEAHFLPIIGEENVAAMPYEIILQDNKATMLHGRFRFASHWPELTMGTFMKIVSTPGDVNDVMESLTK